MISTITSVTNVARHVHRHRAHRQGRPPAAPAHRLRRHGGDARAHGARLHAVDGLGRATMTRSTAVGRHRPGRRQPVRRVLRRDVGPARVGAARRDVPQPHPRRRARRRGGRAVDRELPHHGDVPAAAGRVRGVDPVPACTRSSRRCPSSSCSGRCPRPRASSWRTWRASRSDRTRRGAATDGLTDPPPPRPAPLQRVPAAAAVCRADTRRLISCLKQALQIVWLRQATKGVAMSSVPARDPAGRRCCGRVEALQPRPARVVPRRRPRDRLLQGGARHRPDPARRGPSR